MEFLRIKAFYFVLFFLTLNILSDRALTNAQTPENAFSSFNISASVISNTNKNLLHRFWYPKKGFELKAETPFYFGKIQLGVIYVPFVSKTDLYPDFKENLLFLGIGKEISLPYKFKLYSGLRVGYFMMSFNDDTLSVYQKNESEFSTGINFRLNYEVITNLFLSASSDFTVLFTYEKLKFYYLSAGLSYKFSSPQWLKDFFN